SGRDCQGEEPEPGHCEEYPSEFVLCPGLQRTGDSHSRRPAVPRLWNFALPHDRGPGDELQFSIRHWECPQVEVQGNLNPYPGDNHIWKWDSIIDNEIPKNRYNVGPI